MTRLFQVTTPTFCAGFVYASGIIHPFAPILAPILRSMTKWPLTRIMRYCRQKGYTLTEVAPMPTETSPTETWTPPPLPHWPDQRKRHTLLAKIEQARRKAVDMDIVYLLDELTKLLQCVSMASRGVIEQASDADKDVPNNTVPEIDPDVPEIISGTETISETGISETGGVRNKQDTRPRGRPRGPELSAAERKRAYRRKQAEKIIKG